MHTHILIQAYNDKRNTATLCYYSQDNPTHTIISSDKLEKITCPDCLLEYEKRFTKKAPIEIKIF